MIPDNCINTLIGTFQTETLVYDKVPDARKDTNTNHFDSHSRTQAQGYRNFACCDPLISVNTFDNDSSATFTVDLGAADQKPRTAFHLSVLFPLSTMIFSVPLHPGSPSDQLL